MRRLILAAVFVPTLARAQPAPEVPISVRTIQAAIEQLNNGGSFAQSKVIAADLSDQANAWMQREKAAAEKQKADAEAAAKSAPPATPPKVP
jgi:hypothetical protein